ncbi:hypothetical protein BASA81_018358 [Batrachochytrium salamandrivorans]|nr:hypothetical protein BASA81_018358 [Batrachochytrium salamandrivorans]
MANPHFPIRLKRCFLYMRSNKGKQPLYSTSPDASSSVKSRSMTSNRPLSQAMSSSPSQASLPPSVHLHATMSDKQGAHS